MTNKKFLETKKFDTEKYSGIIKDKEVEMHRLAKHWAIDIVRHTSDDTKELVEGWVVGDEYKALALYDEKVKEITQEAIR